MQSSMPSSTNLEANKESKNKNKNKKKKKNSNNSSSNPEGACPVVTWKSMMHSWSLQYKAPGLCCKLMAKARTPAALLKLSCVKGTRNNWGKLAGQEQEQEEEEEVRHNRVSLELLPTSNSQPPPPVPRRSDASSASGSTSTPLGSPYPSSKLAHLGSSSPSPSLSLSSSSSSRLRGLVSAPAGQRSFLHLFGGNQFLTHVTAAPVGGRRSADLAPSAGLVNVPRRHSDAHLGDRIIFFQ